MNTIVPPAFASTPVLPTRASSFLDSVLTEHLSDAETSSDNRLTLEKMQSEKLLAFLRNHAVSTVDIHKPIRGLRVNLFPVPALNKFVQDLFAESGSLPDVRRLISWVEITDSKMSSLAEAQPKRFTFVLHRDVVVRRRLKTPKESGERFSYERRTFMRLEFMHAFTGREQQPVLDMRCDLASFQQNPSAKYSLGRELTSDDERQLVFLLNFFLFPLRELNRVLRGWTSPQSWFVMGPESGRPVEVQLSENPFSPIDPHHPYAIFKRKDLHLDDDLQCPYLDRLRIDSLSFSFQPTLSIKALKAISGELTPTEVALEERANATVRSLVALQSAIFSSRRYYSDGSLGFSHRMRVETGFKGIGSAWKDAPDATLNAMAGASDAQRIESVSLQLFRPVHNHSLFTIGFRTFDCKAIARQFQQFGEYDSLRMAADRDNGVDMPSAPALLKTLNRSVEVSVSVHSRVLTNNFSIRSVEDLKRKILADYNGKVEELSIALIQMALTNSDIYYWNAPKRWLPWALSGEEEVNARLESWAEAAVATRHFEGVSSSRWAFMQRLPSRLSAESPEAAADLRSLFELSMMPEGKKKINRVRAVPELAFAAFFYWNAFPSENIWDILRDGDFIPEEWKAALLVPRQTQDPKQRAMYRLLRETCQFALNNFGVDMAYPKDLHLEVGRKSVEVLTTSKSRLSSKQPRAQTAALQALSNDSALTSLSYPGAFFRDLQAGKLFRPRKKPQT